jgi:hypothetical protein
MGVPFIDRELLAALAIIARHDPVMLGLVRVICCAIASNYAADARSPPPAPRRRLRR